MPRSRDLRDGTAKIQYDEFTTTKEDGTVIKYRVARQPMPVIKPVREKDSGLSVVMKRVSKHFKGWSSGPTLEQRRNRKKAERQARKAAHAVDISRRRNK